MRLIDADALIEQIAKNMCEPCRNRKEDYDGVRCRACQYGDEMDDIEDAPTIEPQKWIPCSERLPEKKQTVIVSVNDGYAEYTEVDEWTGTGFWAHGPLATAWMPLPEPYKE